jgi:hypothetical protein
MTYDDLTAALAELAQQTVNPAADYTAYIPTAIQNGELRALRDMTDLLASHGQNTTLICTPNNSVLSLVGMPVQVADPIVFQGAPLAYTNPVTVERLDIRVGTSWIPAMRASLDYVNLIWPDTSVTGTPVFGSTYFAMLDDQNAIIAPAPILAFTVRVTGTWRPATLSTDNQTSYLSVAFPDLLVASCMVEIAGYMANFGAQSDDPRQAVSWLQQYHERLTAARAEERRRKGLPPEPPPQAAMAAPAG